MAQCSWLSAAMIIFSISLVSFVGVCTAIQSAIHWVVGSNLRVVRPLTQSLLEFSLKGLHKTIRMHNIKGTGSEMMWNNF